MSLSLSLFLFLSFFLSLSVIVEKLKIQKDKILKILVVICCEKFKLESEFVKK